MFRKFMNMAVFGVIVEKRFLASSADYAH